jgi:Fe-S-cluster-containing dehydrogenase component
MKIIEKERGKYPQAVKVAYIPLPCLHCDEALCIKSAQKGEIYRRPDGIIIIDPEKAKGQKQLVSSCPYRVMYWNDEKNIPQKCTLCAHLLDAGWKEPRCVESCPTAALKFGDLDDHNSEVAKLVASGKVEILHPEYGMKEKVSYIGLPKRFIAGAVIFGDKDECAENVSVTLTDEQTKKTMKTDNFGDFNFDGLLLDKQYKVRVSHTGYRPQVFNVVTKDDIYLGDIVLSKRK